MPRSRFPMTPPLLRKKMAARLESRICVKFNFPKETYWDVLAEARKEFTTEDWKEFLLRSIGLNPTSLSERNKNAFFLRMVPFVERNYNLVELGPRGTGKSHLFQQVSPYAHLISGGKATVAQDVCQHGHRATRFGLPI